MSSSFFLLLPMRAQTAHCSHKNSYARVGYLHRRQCTRPAVVRVVNAIAYETIVLVRTLLQWESIGMACVDHDGDGLGANVQADAVWSDTQTAKIDAGPVVKGHLEVAKKEAAMVEMIEAPTGMDSTFGDHESRNGDGGDA